MAETSEQTASTTETKTEPETKAETKAPDTKTKTASAEEQASAKETEEQIEAVWSMWQGIDRGYELIEKMKKFGLFTPRPPLRKAARKLAQITGQYPVPNLAVDACMAAFTKMTKEAKDKYEKEPADKQISPSQRSTSVELIKEAGRLGFCDALPRLSTRDDVTDFIACVVHGMALRILPGQEGNRLIYGANAASNAFPPRKKYKKKCVKSTSQAAFASPVNKTESAA